MLHFSKPKAFTGENKSGSQSDLVEPHSSVGRIAHLRTASRWFDPRLGQYSFRGLMIVIETGFIPLSPLSIISTMIMWEAASGFERLLCGVLVRRTPGKHG